MGYCLYLIVDYQELVTLNNIILVLNWDLGIYCMPYRYSQLSNQCKGTTAEIGRDVGRSYSSFACQYKLHFRSYIPTFI